MQYAFFTVPFLSLAAVCAAQAWIGLRQGRGPLWLLAALAAALPPLALIVLILADPTGKVVGDLIVLVMMPAIYVSPPVAALLVWLTAVAQ